jgi:hypothetical protein
MVSLIYAGEALRHLSLDLASFGEGTDIRTSVTDEHGQLILGGIVEPTAAQVRRSLSAAELPWQLNVAALSTDTGGAFPAERRNYLIAVLAAIVLLVGLACYAMARGVLREAAAGQLQSDFVSTVSHEFRSRSARKSFARAFAPLYEETRKARSRMFTASATWRSIPRVARCGAPEASWTSRPPSSKCCRLSYAIAAAC